METKISGSALCKQCGRMFWQLGGKGRPRQYCSDRCKQRHWRVEQRRAQRRRAYPSR